MIKCVVPDTKGSFKWTTPMPQEIGVTHALYDYGSAEVFMGYSSYFHYLQQTIHELLEIWPRN